MERKTPCRATKRTQETRRGNTQYPLVSRSFQQVADAANYKAAFRGTQQEKESFVPYRSSRRPATPDMLDESAQQVRIRRNGVQTEDIPTLPSHRRSIPWKRCVVAAAVILYSLYAAYTSWVDPFLTTIHNQWHYGDARISYASMTMNGKVRDLLGIGYKGQVEVIILPDPKDSRSQATLYLDPQPFNDRKNRVVLLHPGYVNQADRYPDILVEIEGTQGASPVLYGQPDGSFQWNSPPAQKG